MAETSTLKGVGTGAVIVAYTAATRIIMLMPLVVGVWANVHHLTNQQLGYLASIEFLGIALGTASAPLWIEGKYLKEIAIIALAMLAVVDWATFSPQSFESLAMLRSISGIATGVVASLSTALLAYSRNPDQAFAYFMSGQFLVGAIGFFALPILIASAGPAALMFTLVGIDLMGVVAAILMPRMSLGNISPPSHEAAEAGAKRALNIAAVLVLVAGMAFFVTQMGLWPYLERLGNSSGLSQEQTGLALSVSSVICIFTALTVGPLTRWLGRATFLVIQVAVQIASLIGLLFAGSFPIYLAAVIGFNVVWSITPSVLFGLLTDKTEDDRLVSIFPLVLTIGMAIGPALAALVLGHNSFDRIIMTAIFFLVLFLLIVFPVARVVRERAEAT